MEDGVHPPQTTRYAYSGGRVLEEQDNTGTPQASYVYGRYIDEPVQMKRGDDTTVYYHSDDLHNVTALTNAEGAVVERYRYDDFGAPHVFSASGDPRPASSVGNPYLSTGRAYDPDLQLYDYRTRHLHPGLGRFTSRDRIGLWGDPMNMGNPYSYVGNAPGMFTDPYGLERWGEQSYLADAVDVGYGYFISGPIDLVSGAVRAVAHLSQTAEGLATIGQNLYNDFSGTTGGLASLLYAQLEDSDTAGQAAFGVASTVVPFAPGAAKALVPALRSAAVAEKAVAAGGTLACEAAGAAKKVEDIASLQKKLIELAQEAAETVGEGKGRFRGTEVHSEFRRLIKALGRDDLFTERSYLKGNPVRYGRKRSIRADVVFGPVDNPVAIFDLKTGDAVLSPKRIAEIQGHLPPVTTIPVIEIKP